MILPSGSEVRATRTRDVYTEPLWYAGYTRARHEKRVAEQLRQRSVECFLPLYETVHRWQNGRHCVQLPLFPGYLFVRIALRERMRVLQVPSLVDLVGFNGIPVPLPDMEIDTMREVLSSGLIAQPYPYLAAGTRVEIRSGPLRRLTGVLLRRHGQRRLVLSVDLIQRSVIVDLDEADVTPIVERGVSKDWSGFCTASVESTAPATQLH